MFLGQTHEASTCIDQAMTTVRQYQDRAAKTKASVEQIASLLEKMRSEHEQGVSKLAREFAHDYEDFRMWEARIRARWLEVPESYDAALHDTLDEIYTLWFETAHRLASLIDRAQASCMTIQDAEAFQRDYATMLSVELMDRSALPQHLRELAIEALNEGCA